MISNYYLKCNGIAMGRNSKSKRKKHLIVSSYA